MTTTRPDRLDRPVDVAWDHLLGNPDAEITLVEYGSYACPYCHAAHEVIGHLRDRFGDRMRYVYRHLPLADRDLATPAAELAEYADATRHDFWTVHDTLMRRGPKFDEKALEEIATDFNVPPSDQWDPGIARAAGIRVRDDAQSGIRSGARETPTFFINGRRYEGAWDETALAGAMLGSVGHRLQAASLDFARWAPSTGVLLLIMTVLAVVLANTGVGPAFAAWWETPFGFRVGGDAYTLPLIEWVNDGLLAIFFLVVGLEIKRELTVGRLASRRAAALPVAGSIGGMIAPALIYLLVAPPALAHGWGITIATDTAFAVALIVLLGDRVPVDLRVFLTAAVIVDDLVAIVVAALFYAEALDMGYLMAAAGATALLVLLNRSRVYRALPYAVVGVVLWIWLHQAGLHATLAGVILAVVTPTRPPANLSALIAQAESVMEAELRFVGDRVLRHGPSEPTLRALDAILDQVESPASKLLRSVQPWSSYVVLPIFALANAGVVVSMDILSGHGRLMLAIILGLVLGKLMGISIASWLAVRLGAAEKPTTYSWRQLVGAGALAGIGFTMSLFIAGQAFPREADFTAAKIAIFIASTIAGMLGALILWRRREEGQDAGGQDAGERGGVAFAPAENRPPMRGRRGRPWSERT
ncbi:MAG TPA: Na+/H+ antiporter NhaA [Gemmatimonadaceae bacterium]|nr:Na+/H+ antiporter NhaA [Gemmatimonadaceae bacterium]